VRKAFLHNDELNVQRTLLVEVDTERVRIVCDAPGIASVSHVMSWADWNRMVVSVLNPNVLNPEPPA
jgi:hypothetical protein